MRLLLPIITICLLSLSGRVLAQQAPQPNLSAIMATGRADSVNTAIRLRWAASTPMAWKQYNTTGFIVERYTVLRNGKMLEQPEYRLITQQPLKPQPLNAWEAIANRSHYAAIIAQALYGENFEVGGNEKDVTHLINLSQEQEQRYTFALYAADMDYEAACFAGWGLTDSHIQPNEKYLYRIKAAPGKAPADSAAVFIGMEDYQPLPRPGEVMGQFGNKSVMLVWDCARLSSVYSSYFVEKSEDDIRFERLSDVPVGNLNNKQDQPSTRMYLMDSLANNATIYHYRIRGINAFGEVGPPSLSVSGKGRDLLPFVPNIRYAYVDEQGLQVEWEFNEQANHLISGFRLERADNVRGKYETFTDNISPDLRNITISKTLSPSNYFTLTAVAKEGESRTSQAVLVQPIDSMPPVPPVGLTVRIDTTGVARLEWTANTEADLQGYKLFRAMKKGEELVPLTNSVWKTNSYSDTLDMKLINRKMYYAVAALDRRFNQSAFSEIVEAKKPAVIPPSPPLVTRYELKDGKVILEWVNTSDEDADSLRLYRKAANEDKYALLQRYTAREVSTYADSDLQGGQAYAYVLEVSNDGGLRAASDTLHIKTPAAYGAKKQLTRLYAQAQPEQSRIEITWDDKLPNVTGYQVYKATGEQGLSLWKTLRKNEKGVYDTGVTIGTTYRYAVMVVMSPGGYSEMKTITVKY